MSKPKRWAPLAGAATMVVAVACVTAVSALTESDKCATQKMKVAGKYVSCRMNEEAKAIKKGTAPDFSKCNTKFADKWDKIESKAAGACPTEGDLEDVANIAIADAGLMAGTVSAAARFKNNGDGTTTDLHTGLTWENKSYLDDSVHDVSTTYVFQDAFAVHIATLNATSFAGYDDWRVPTPLELLSLINFENPNEIKGYPELDFNCSFECNEPICETPSFDAVTSNCAFSEISSPHTYWTSTTNPEDSDQAIAISSRSLILELEEGKSSGGGHSVMAVRGGRRND